MTEPITRRLLDQRAAAAYLSVGLRTIEKLLADGELLKVRIGASVRIDQRDLDDYIERIKRAS